MPAQPHKVEHTEPQQGTLFDAGVSLGESDEMALVEDQHHVAAAPDIGDIAVSAGAQLRGARWQDPNRRRANLRAGYFRQKPRHGVVPVLAPNGGYIAPLEGTPEYLTQQAVDIAAEMPSAHDFMPTTRAEARYQFPLLEPNAQRQVDTKLEGIHRGAKAFAANTLGYGAKASAWYGDRAVISTLHEFYDFREDAARSLSGLRILESRLESRVLSEPLSASIQVDDPGVGELIRHYVTTVAAKDPALLEIDFNPHEIVEESRTKHNTYDDPQQAEAQAATHTGSYTYEMLLRPHKHIKDVFVTEARSRKVTRYIENMLDNLSVRQAQQILESALTAQGNRKAHWEEVLASPQDSALRQLTAEVGRYAA